MDYSYLEKYNKDLYKHLKVVPWPSNLFYECSQKEIEEAENMLGKRFPSQLRSFYQTIGAGCLVAPHEISPEYKFYGANEILPPLVAAHFSKEIIRSHTEEIQEPIECEDHWMSNDTLEMLEPGDLPFFEIGDSSRFLIMRPYSDKPNAVWTPSRIKIEDSFEQFIWRLYYESPWFYDDIIEKHYGK